jgi:RecA-family ATPase
MHPELAAALKKAKPGYVEKSAAAKRPAPSNELPPHDIAINRAWAMVVANPDESTLQDAAAHLVPHASGAAAEAIADAFQQMAHAAAIDTADADRIFEQAKRQGAAATNQGGSAAASLGSQVAQPKPAPAANGHTATAPIDSSELPTPEEGDYGVPVTIEQPSPAIVPCTFATPASWPQEAPPPVDWLAASRIPRGDVTTLHGDGGAGKTDIALRLAANVARSAPDWLGHEIANGPVILISAEEPEREVRRRLWNHAEHDGYDLASVDKLGMWFPAEDHDTVMATPDRYGGNGIMRPTRLMQEITLAIANAAPVLIVVDNVAATFAGNQNDRVNVRSYVNLWRAIARGPSSPAVLLLDHPSLSGLTNNTGRGGNMDWRNAVRSALYLHPPAEQAEADRGVRVLETVKSNYAPSGNPLRLCWSGSGLQREQEPSSLHRMAVDAECEATFMRLLDERNGQGRPVSDKSGKNYAPSVFAEHTGHGGFTRQAFAKAMERLFVARKITLRTARVDGHNRQVIDRSAEQTTEQAAE